MRRCEYLLKGPQLDLDLVYTGICGDYHMYPNSYYYYYHYNSPPGKLNYIFIYFKDEMTKASVT